jgi:hypothetical protein
MIDPSSFIIDTSRDEELARKLFDDLNHDILGPPGDGKIIILDDSDGEAQEEKTTGTNPRQLLLPTMLLQRQRSVIVMIRGPTRRPMVTTTADIALAILRLPRREQSVVAGVL